MFRPEDIFFCILQVVAALLIFFRVDWMPDFILIPVAFLLVISGLIDLFGG
ncbi:MAG: hypothetical protein HY365_02190 [Candidatus Aenigmarchaeota archaeon]|nr:hypothetical protein [Candidatus Aenigmarchaeota archaeon]